MVLVNEHAIADIEERKRVTAVLSRMCEMDKTYFWWAKRAIDIIAVSIGILVMAIPMLLIMLIIFLSSPRTSPMYRQKRVGRRGKLFNIYKFRTMVPYADKMKEDLAKYNEMDGPVFKIKNDPRVTRFGRFLRRTSLDELPQFFNVLKGDMTIIGPRPPVPSEVAQYTDYQMIRLTVTPGITGLWQVQPDRNDLSFDEWVELDVQYILERSIWLDIKIIIKTVIVMFRGEGR